MDSATSKTTRQSRTLDESGYKFGGDTGENLNSQGKGSSSNSSQQTKGQDMRMLSDKALRRLDALSEVSKKGLVAKDLFRLMSDPTMWMLAYSNIYANKGAVTKGVDNTTMDGFSEDRVLNLIKMLKEGLYSHKPVRRTYIPKGNGRVRPLGIPTGDDKLVQEVARIILERIYKPIFSKDSHGFRPGLSCHTALKSIQRNWTGVKWVVNVDIKSYFDNINHEILIKILEKKINDKRFIKLLKLMLKAGYMERWTYHGTHSGTPQGGIISPLLSNIYLHGLDNYMESLRNGFNMGKRRAVNNDYNYWHQIIYKRRKALDLELEQYGESDKATQLRAEIANAIQERMKYQSADAFDPKYRRLLYCRYADDFTIGIIGNKEEANKIFGMVKTYLADHLDLEISSEKSGVSHFKDGFTYLGHLIRSESSDKVMKVRMGKRVGPMRTVTERVALRVPPEKGLEFARKHKYVAGDNLGRWTPRPGLLYRSDEEIISTYNAEIRGLTNYYALAKDVKHKLGRLEYLCHSSMLATLASKHKTSIGKLRKRMSRRGELVYESIRSKKGLTLKAYKLKHLKTKKVSWNVDVVENTNYFKHSKTELIDRLNADTCEYCGRTGGFFEVHHVGKLKGLKEGTLEKSMAAMRRKTIILCHHCHRLSHAGKLPDMRPKRS